MVKKYKIFVLTLLGGLLFFSFIQLNQYNFPTPLSNHYINEGIKETGAINLITAILFDYRGFDTLGEATVILAAAATLGFLVPKKRIPMLTAKFTIIVHQAISFITPFLVVLGFYLIFFGHLSPGGGFTGGVVLATVPILFTITFGPKMAEDHFRPQHKNLLESSGALMFVLIGLLGIAAGSTFLANAQAGIPLGQPGNLVSAGTIPYLNLAVGLKVGAGLSIIFNCLIKED